MPEKYGKLVAEGPCYSARVVQPFVRLLASDPEYSTLSYLPLLSALEPDERLPIALAHDSLLESVAHLGDLDLGLKAGRLAPMEVGGALPYALQSAATLRQSMKLAMRFAQVLSDTLTPRLEIDGERAIVRMDNTGAWPRAAADFTLSSWYTESLRVQLGDAPELECWFRHERPSRTDEYERTFGSAKLRFNAPGYGFAFHKDRVEAPLPGANATLHAVAVGQLEMMLASLQGARNFSACVRERIAHALADGRATTQGIACQFRMSPRTFLRRLASQGTTFTSELDQVRRQLALRYVASREVPLEDVSHLLGFAHVPAFHRAFKRWTQSTPHQYRSACDR